MIFQDPNAGSSSSSDDDDDGIDQDVYKPPVQNELVRPRK